MISCSDKNSREIHHWAKDVIFVLHTYEWLLNAFVLDFFEDSHWAQLPDRWREFLDSMEPTSLGHWLNSDSYNGLKFNVSPLSLIALKAAVKSLSLPRKPVKGLKTLFPFLSQCCSKDKTRNTCLFKEEVDFEEWGSAENELSVAAGQHGRLAHVFRKHVKPKKQHEIVRLAQVTSLLAQESSCHCILDVGSGVGHLARLLSYGHGLRLVCLEAEDSFTASARKFDSDFKYAMKRSGHMSSGQTLTSPAHQTLHLTPDLDCLWLDKTLSDWYNESPFSFGIVGLHTCGDLGPILIKIFTESDKCKLICSVGCCYMKLSTDRSGTNFCGYPLSNFIQHQAHHLLSYEARELSCHAQEMYCKRLVEGHVKKLKIHCYRAVLETIIMKNWPNLKHSGLRSVKNAEEMEFERYAFAAVSKLGIDLPVEDVRSAETERLLAQWKRVVSFYSLRLLLAPLVETLILLDRMLFMHEKGTESCLFAAFDPQISPRNHILIGLKTTCGP